jgi:hypothetical protein
MLLELLLEMHLDLSDGVPIAEGATTNPIVVPFLVQIICPNQFIENLLENAK